MIYVSAIREGHFLLYTDALITVAPWLLLALCPLCQMRDIVSLKDIHRGLFDNFRKGNVVIKTAHVIAGIAID